MARLNRAYVRGGYMPLDMLLEQMPVRVLRRLSHYDWINIVDFRDIAMNAEPNPKPGCQSKERNCLSNTLKRQTRLGHVERRSNGARRTNARLSYDIRITAAGREWLRKRLNQPLLVADERDFADEEASC